MLRIIIDDKVYELEISKNGKLSSGKINNTDFFADIYPVDEFRKHVIRDNKSYNVEITEINQEEKKLTLRINGNIYPVKVLDELDILLQEMGMDNLASKKIKELKAPMPGLVLDIAVKEGDIVKEGDKLLVLEAMKMENNLKAEAEAKVQSIQCQKGQAVEKNEVLIVFE